MRIIINADDCGRTDYINKRIENYILDGLISSTTIMANMPAVEYTKEMYDKYHEHISFGVHLNLTEGTPLIYNQELLDKGIYVQNCEGVIMFNKELASINKTFSNEINAGIFKELCAQIDVINDLGIHFSHIDSHHHIHTRPYMLRIIPMLQHKYKFTKIRRMRNYIPNPINRAIRNTWYYIIKNSTQNMKTTDYFTSFMEFIEHSNNGFIIRDKTIELMVHPGGFEDEIEAPTIRNNNLRELFNAEIINYNQL